MAFPEEFSVARNLRDIKAELAALRRAKQAGRTSLGPSDGAMEIRNASGQPVALVGHSGSAGGLLVRNRENTAWVSLADERSRIDGRIDTVWISIDSHAGRLSTAEGSIGTLQTASSGHATRLTALETESTLLQGWLANFAAYVSVLNARINALDGGSNPGPPLPGGGA